MKWVTLICLFLCTIVTESRHLHKRDVEHHTREIGPMFLQIGKTNFDLLVMVLSAQNFQKCEHEEHLKVAQEISAFGQHCVDHEGEEKCKKQMIAIFHETICKHPNLEERYPWSVECCAKAEPEREKCFHDHRDIEVEPYQKPDAEAACKQHKEHPEQAFSYYAFNVARRHSSMYPPAVLEIARQYKTIMTECCAEEEKVKCFDNKFTEVKKYTDDVEQKFKHICNIVSSFPDRAYLAIKIAKISQKHCNADYEVVKKLAAESLHMMKDCCRGDVVECMAERMEYTQHICDDHEKISPNLKACCEKPQFERTPCMIGLPNDEHPEDLPPMTTFLENEHLCKDLEEHKDDHLAKFLYEFARRNQKLSIQANLRCAKGYEELSTKCCATDHALECMKNAPKLLEDGIKESKDLVKQNCDAFQDLGPYGYHIMLLGRYIKKMPQMSDATMVEMTGKMTKLGAKCCALPEDQRLLCAEENLDLLIGQMCEKEAHTFINDQVHHCCINSYANRRLCLTKLGLDPSYIPQAFDKSSFQVGANICEGSEEEQKFKRLTWLTRAYKVKPDIQKEKMSENIEEFSKVREKCCPAEDRQTCFDLERPALLLHFKATLEH